MDDFLESGPSKVNIWDKNAYFSLDSDTFLKHRCLLVTEVRHWTIPSIKISFLSLLLSLSLYSSLSTSFPFTTSPFFTFSRNLMSQIYLWLSWMYYLNDDIIPFFLSNILPLSSHSLSYMQAVVQKKFLWLYGEILSLRSKPNPSQCQPCTVSC